MENIKLFFNLADAINFCSTVLDLDHSNLEADFEGCEFIPQSVFEKITTIHDFQMMKRGLVWLTENDTKVAGPERPLN